MQNAPGYHPVQALLSRADGVPFSFMFVSNSGQQLKQGLKQASHHFWNSSPNVGFCRLAASPKQSQQSLKKMFKKS